MTKKVRLPQNNWHVWEDTDVGTRICYPWITRDHAVRLAALLNEMQEYRALKAGVPRDACNFYTAKKDTSQKK